MNINFNFQPVDHIAEIALFVSIVSLLVSIAFETLTSFRENKVFRAELEASHYDKIFQEYLIEIIPKARQEIHIVNSSDLSYQTLKGIDSLADSLEVLRKKALYFYYADKGFYESLSNSIQKCIDHLYQNSDAPGFSSEKASNILAEISTNLEGIYSCISKKHHGKKFRRMHK